MNLNTRLRRLEGTFGEPGVCPVCRGHGAPLYRATFENGDPPVEGGACLRCKGVGCKTPCAKEYRMPSREMFDCV